MLHVAASVGESKIHRLGLIARAFIPAGTVVWRFQPHFDVCISPEMLRTLSPSAQEQTVYWSFFDETNQVYLMSSDDDRFTNHADDPNTRVHPETYNCTIAVRDIQEGEEITNNYDELGMLRMK